jgi:hypothetical protein
MTNEMLNHKNESDFYPCFRLEPEVPYLYAPHRATRTHFDPLPPFPHSDLLKPATRSLKVDCWMVILGCMLN